MMALISVHESYNGKEKFSLSPLGGVSFFGFWLVGLLLHCSLGGSDRGTNLKQHLL